MKALQRQYGSDLVGKLFGRIPRTGGMGVVWVPFLKSKRRFRGKSPITFRQSIFLLVSVGIIATLAACTRGGGYGGGGGSTTYTVGGMVTGLTGSGLVLRDNGGDNLAVSATGSFTFATKLATGAAYSVTVYTQPSSPSQTCVVTNGSGTVGASNVTSAAVACATNYTVGGMVTGLTGTGLVLRNNGGDDLSVSTAGAFTFATAVPSGMLYSVTVFTQPTGPSQTCAVTNASGTVGASNITNVLVTCTTNSYTVGGMVTGLKGSGLVLRNNGGDNLSVTAAGAFTFATAVASGMPYNVTVFSQPSNPSQTCAVTNASGTIGTSNVTNVLVACTTNTYTIGGTVTGLTGSGLVLRDNGGDNLSVTAAGPFTFSTAVASGMPYSVTVFTQPSNPGQTCVVSSGSGTVGASKVTSVSVACTVNSYSVGGMVTGLTGSGLVLRNNGGDDLIVSTAGAFTFATSVPSGMPYNVTVFAQPASPNPSCNVASGTGSGTVTNANVTTVVVACGRFAFLANSGPGTVSSYSVNGTTGALTAVASVPTAGTNPFIVTIHPSGKFAYVVNLNSNDASAYTIDAATGALTAVAGSPFATGGSFGNRPQEVIFDPSGKFAYVANLSGNNVSAYTVDATTGALTPIAGSPFAAGAAPWIVQFDPSGKFAYLANTNSNNISAYTIDATTGALTPIAGSPFATGSTFSTPYPGTFHPSGKFVYFPNQTADTVSAYTINTTTGALTPIAGSPFATGVHPANVAIDPSGKFAYIGNQASNDVSAYTINTITGALTPIAGSPFATGGLAPGVTLDPSGKFAYTANSDSNNISAFTIDATTGALTPIAGSPFAVGMLPNGVQFDPTGKFAYTVNHNSNNISGYTIDATTGALIPIAGSPFATGSLPYPVAFSK
jgi:6-phosphogluconolactonase (cycloisomerase 2 family)/predicted transcriptional regulator